MSVSKHRASRRTSAGLISIVGALVLVVAVAVTVAVVALPSGRADPSSAIVRTTHEPAPVPSVEPIALATTGSLDAVVVEDPLPPQNSGAGRRIVFDQGDQRVWLIEGDEVVARTYLVSGSRFENLQPGAYQVSSKTRHATAFDASGTMEYFVRFATGFSEPIGFHSVPRDNAGKLEQAKAQLGQRLSAGCVRQWKNDAIALWDFAPIGTKVHVTP